MYAAPLHGVDHRSRDRECAARKSRSVAPLPRVDRSRRRERLREPYACRTPPRSSSRARRGGRLLASAAMSTPFAWHPEPELISFGAEDRSRPSLEELGSAVWREALDYLYRYAV